MAVPLVAFVIAALVAGAAVLPPVLRLYRKSRREAAFATLAALAFALGAAPIFRIVMFRSMLAKDHGWVVRGPEPFGSLGGGPWWLWTLVYSVMASGILWGLGFWILNWARPSNSDRGADDFVAD